MIVNRRPPRQRIVYIQFSAEHPYIVVYALGGFARQYVSQNSRLNKVNGYPYAL
jgi:hypothetical protein